MTARDVRSRLRITRRASIVEKVAGARRMRGAGACRDDSERARNPLRSSVRARAQLKASLPGGFS
jgi:hypothetical protein